MRSRFPLLILVSIALATWLLSDWGRSASASDPPSQVLRSYAEKGDFLSARAYLRKISARPSSYAEWKSIRSVLFEHPSIGDDLIQQWNKVANQKTVKPVPDTSQDLEKADALLLGGKPAEAFKIYQDAARFLKTRREKIAASSPSREDVIANIDYLYPYVLHGMARSLYSMERFDDALLVYQWIRADYTRFRQTLFERMWAAFRAGRVDLALGSIASQRSRYFSRFLEPEAYLVEIYLYTALCRSDDLSEVLDQIQRFQKALESGAFGYEEWAKMETETYRLLQIVKSPKGVGDSQVTMREREKERAALIKELSNRFSREKARILKQLKLSQAYSQLAATPGMGAGLKPVVRIKGREELLNLGFETWPTSSQEEWVDEVGKHVFMGESRCQADSASE